MTALDDGLESAGDSHRSVSRRADWLTAVAPEFTQLGWQDFMRSDQVGDGIAIATLDVVPEYDAVIHAEGPPAFSISLFVEGEGTLAIDGGAPLPIRPGTAVICATEGYVRGCDTLVGGKRILMVDMRFQHQRLSQIGGPLLPHVAGGLLVDRSVPDVGAFLIGFPAPADLLVIARQVLDCAYPEGGVRRLYLQAKALEALAVTIAAMTDVGGAPKALAQRDRRRLEEARQLIEENYADGWTIDRLARCVGLNEKKLKAGFRLLVGRSIHAHLIHVRLEAAVEMLGQGLSVTEVALACGFGNLSHFSHTFRKMKGVTPRDYARTSFIERRS